jgi:hypothetical protein
VAHGRGLSYEFVEFIPSQKLIFDGKTVSLDPSIGNWSFRCKSHYWIRDGKVKWSRQWSREEIEVGRARDRLAKENHFGTTTALADVEEKKSKWNPGGNRSGGRDRSHLNL